MFVAFALENNGKVQTKSVSRISIEIYSIAVYENRNVLSSWLGNGKYLAGSFDRFFLYVWIGQLSSVWFDNFRMIVMFQAKLYKSVIDEVINGVREAFLDEGIDEQVLQELKQVQYMLTR